MGSLDKITHHPAGSVDPHPGGIWGVDHPWYNVATQLLISCSGRKEKAEDQTQDLIELLSCKDN